MEAKILSGLREGEEGWHNKERNIPYSNIYIIPQPSTLFIVGTFSKPLIMRILQASIFYPLFLWSLIFGLINKFME